MKILIISGFLGAGKTTFIKELIRRTGKSFVILENEYGSTDVDEQVLTAEEDTDVWDLTEGCICCTKSSDLNASVMTIESTIEPEYLVIEPSGVGALSNVIRNLQKIEYERIRLLKPITIIDAERFLHDQTVFGDVYQDQIRTASILVISKPDHPQTELYEVVKKNLQQLNLGAELIPVHYTQMPQEWWDSLLITAYDGSVFQEVKESYLNLETFTISSCWLESPAVLLWILQNVILGKYGEIVRAKGILPAGHDWIRFDIVDGTFSITGFDKANEEPKAECVWIGRAIDRIGLMMNFGDPVSIGIQQQFNRDTTVKKIKHPVNR